MICPVVIIAGIILILSDEHLLNQNSAFSVTEFKFDCNNLLVS